MTREEAIKILNAIKMLMCRPDGTPISDGYEALDMAIEALRAEPTDTDLISREDAIDAFWEDSDIRTGEVRATLKALPSAEAVHIETYRELYEKYVELKHTSAETEHDHKDGQWQTEDGRKTKAEYSVYCSKCGSWSEYRTKYCGSCGSLMKEENNDK